uniref:Uncharacterized protein n=1 Tax=Knipowitschia caucasica TaxID=637954 RepID=A0AAV2IX27_KNICA
MRIISLPTYSAWWLLEDAHSLFQTIKNRGCTNWGGKAMLQLHRLVSSDADVIVHIDSFAAETGVSRFLELHKNWRYDKREDMSPTNQDIKLYTHLIMEANVTKIQQLQDTHQPLAFIDGYSKTMLDLFHVPPVNVLLQNKIVLMERTKDN